MSRQRPTPSGDLTPSERIPPPLPPAEVDHLGRRLCGAKTRSGGRCRQPAMRGAARCKMHGGMSPTSKQAAKIRLSMLVQPAIATLGREMVKAEKSSDRQRAANSILDRSGYGRVTRVEGSLEDARAMLLERIRELRAGGVRPDDDDGDVIDAEILP